MLRMPVCAFLTLSDTIIAPADEHIVSLVGTRGGPVARTLGGS